MLYVTRYASPSVSLCDKLLAVLYRGRLQANQITGWPDFMLPAARYVLVEDNLLYNPYTVGDVLCLIVDN